MDEVLLVVEAGLAGEHIADAERDRHEGQVLGAEELYGEKDRGEGGVGHAAEHAYEAETGAERGGQADERRSCAAEGGADEE